MAQQFSFDRTYLEYYQDRLERASDGTRVPGLGVTAALVERMRISAGQRVLDVGCSFGRLLPILRPLTEEVFGLELSYDVVDVAAQKGYRCVVRGGAEDTNLPSSFFSHAVLFGVFDCCDQVKTLRELRRVLVPGGCALVTGKNVSYAADDRLALTAERNAWRKSFPNSFTHVAQLVELLPTFGLTVAHLLRFERRGDFGEMRALGEDAPMDAPCYEFAAILTAIEQPSSPAEITAAQVSSRVSSTARSVAAANGFASVEKFFESDWLDTHGQ